MTGKTDCQTAGSLLDIHHTQQIARLHVKKTKYVDSSVVNKTLLVTDKLAANHVFAVRKSMVCLSRDGIEDVHAWALKKRFSPNSYKFFLRREDAMW